MTRQTFTKGQRVFARGFDSYREAEVVNPDIVQTSFGPNGREVHYVGIRYIREGKMDGHDWSVLNNRQRIITSEAYVEIERGRQIERLRSTVQIHTRWEEKFTAYTEQAKDLIGLVQTSAGRADVLELLVALQLKGIFDLRTERSRHTVEEIAELRAERKADADVAEQSLDELGATKLWGQAPEGSGTS